MALPPRIALIHGFNVADAGAGSIGQLTQPLADRGLQSFVFGYPWTFVVRLYGVNRGATQKLLEMRDEIDAVIAHSNGCLITLDALNAGLKLRWVGMVNPALRVRTKLPPSAESVDVWYSPGDLITTAGKFWRYVTRPLPWRWRNPHQWGEAGRRGFSAPDHPDIRQHEMWRAVGHSGALRTEAWQTHISGIAQQRLA